MRCYTESECEAWLTGRERKNPDLIPGVQTQRIEYPPESHRLFFVAHWIATEITYTQPTLLFITEWGIWGSSENWHLYYKLRQTYGDSRLLDEAPGHLFLDYEAEDLATFLQISMLNGWGGYILTDANYVNAFFSHDEYIDFFAEPPHGLTNIREELGMKQEAGGNSAASNSQ